MSDASALQYDTNAADSAARPSHHVHTESQPLPATAARQEEALDNGADLDGTGSNTVMAGEQHATSGRPLGVRETPQGA